MTFIKMIQHNLCRQCCLVWHHNCGYSYAFCRVHYKKFTALHASSLIFLGLQKYLYYSRYLI